MWFKFLFGREETHKCESCETLRQQLQITNEEKRELIGTITGLLKPKINYERTIENAEPILPKVMTVSRRRAMLERKDAEEARIRNESKVIGQPDAVPDAIKKLEEELGVEVQEVH